MSEHVEKLAIHHSHAPGHAHHPDAVVAGCADDAADVRAVADIIHRLSGAQNGVNAINIIDIAIAVIIDAIGALVMALGIQAGLAGIEP